MSRQTTLSLDTLNTVRTILRSKFRSLPLREQVEVYFNDGKRMSDPEIEPILDFYRSPRKRICVMPNHLAEKLKLLSFAITYHVIQASEKHSLRPVDLLLLGCLTMTLHAHSSAAEACVLLS